MIEKDAGMRIRVERSLRDEFVEVCRARDLSAAQVIRAFMRDYISETRREDDSQDNQKPPKAEGRKRT
jgi:antitoxin component of RelBE/YafQ-DinJ toxin-antitoxin module